MSAIGLGTWQFGSSEWGYGHQYASTEAGPIVLRALELGVNLVDTAEIYGFGSSERIVGEAIPCRRDLKRLVDAALVVPTSGEAR